jgi:hypothetical protein
VARSEIHFVFIHAPKGFADEVLQRLTRIERALNIEGKIMAKIKDELTIVEGALDALTADEQRELADLTAIKNQGTDLSPEDQARFDAIVAKLHQGVADIDAVDPPPAAPIGDGSGDAPAEPPVDTTPVDAGTDPEAPVADDGSADGDAPVDEAPVATS